MICKPARVHVSESTSLSLTCFVMIMVMYDTDVFHTMQDCFIYYANALLMSCVCYNYPAASLSARK